MTPLCHYPNACHLQRSATQPDSNPIRSITTYRYSPLDPSEICMSVLGGGGGTAPSILQVSCDQLLMAAACHGEIRLYSVPELASVSGGLANVSPVRTLELPPLSDSTKGAQSAIRSIGWCQAKGSEGSFLVLTGDNALLLGGVGSPGFTRVADDVEAAAWSPDSACFAYIESERMLVFSALEGTELQRIQLNHSDGKAGTSCP